MASVTICIVTTVPYLAVKSSFAFENSTIGVSIVFQLVKQQENKKNNKEEGNNS